MSPDKRAYDRTSYILVVDDDNTLLKFFKIHLNKFFSRVIVVKNAKEATEALAEKEIDLVLTDIRMPRMDGLQLMKRVRKNAPAVPVLLISGAMLSEEQEESTEKADGYLRKPFSVDDLHDFINNGMELREKYKRLDEIVGDKKGLQNILRGKAKVAKFAKEEELEEGQKLLAEIRPAE